MDNNITRTLKISVCCYIHKYHTIATGITSAMLLCMGFTTKHRLDDHKRLCQLTEAQHEVFPYSDPILKFINVKKQLKAPLVAYADFESILISQGDITSAGSVSATYQEPVPCSYGYKIVSIDPDIVVHFGEDAVIKFR